MKNIWANPTKADAKLIDKTALTDFRRSFGRKINNKNFDFLYLEYMLDLLESWISENDFNYTNDDFELSKKLICFLDNSSNNETKFDRREVFYKYQYLLIPVNLKINKQELLGKLQFLTEPYAYDQLVSTELINLIQDGLEQYFNEGININGKLKSFDDLPKNVQQKINLSANSIIDSNFKLDLSNIFNGDENNLNILFKNLNDKELKNIKDKSNLRIYLCFKLDAQKNCCHLLIRTDNNTIELDF